MKNIVRTIGIIGGIALFTGCIFKIMHYPGASALIVLSAIPLLIFLFGWLGFVLKNTENAKEKNAYLTLGISLFIMIIGALFKAMHWPGANLAFNTHYIVVLILLPVFFMYLASETNVTKKTSGTAFLVFYLAISGLFLVKGGISAKTIMAYENLSNKTKEVSMNIDANNSLLLNAVSDSTNAEQLTKLKELSTDFDLYINDLKSHLISEVEKVSKEEASKLDLTKIVNKDNYDVPTFILIGDGDPANLKTGAFSASELKYKIESYKNALLATASPEKKDELSKRIGLNTSDNNLEIDGVKYNWEMENFFHTSLYGDLALLSQIQESARLAETAVLISMIK